MKKILVSMFLLVFGLCLVGCEHSTYGYQFHFCVDGGNGTISIETSSSFNPDVKLCRDAGDMCTLDCVEESYFIKLNGGENGSREIVFIATPNIGYQVKEWLFNGEIVEGNKTNSYTAIVTSEDDYVGVIAVRFEEIICNHQWGIGIEIDTGTSTPVVEYTCKLCGNKYRKTLTVPVLPSECPYEWIKNEESHSINMLCDCHKALAVDEPHEDLNSNQICDVCGYVFDTTGINGYYQPELIAYKINDINLVKEVLEDFSLWIQKDILYLDSCIFANGKISELYPSETKYFNTLNLDEFYYENDEDRDLVKELFSQESYYAPALESYPERVSQHYLKELNGNLYYIYIRFSVVGLDARKDVYVFKLNK